MPLPLKLPFTLITKTLFKTPQQGAETSIFLASSDSVKDVSGKYFIDSKEAQLKPYISDMEKCKVLWEESLKIAKINESDPKI